GGWRRRRTQFRSRPGGSASRCGWRAAPRNRLRRGGGESAGCARLLQIQPPHPRPCNHRHPGRSGNLYGVRRGRSASRRSARLRIPARCCPACFSTPGPRSAVFRTSPIHFPRRSACRESHGANAETCPLTLVVLDWSQAGRLSAPVRHALKALCLYCVTGDEPSPDLLTRLLESNRKSIRIPLPQGTGDPLHAAFEIVQQLALQGYPVPLNLPLLRKSFLTLDGITRQLDPDSNAGLETIVYASGVFSSEAVVRTWSIQFLWLDRPDFYRSGLPTRTLAAHLAGTIRKKFVHVQKACWRAFRKPVRCSIQKLRNL